MTTTESWSPLSPVRTMTSGGDINFIFCYLLLCSGLISFFFSVLGAGAAYVNYSDKALLVISSVYCLHLLCNRKIVLTGLTLFIAAYIVIRLVAVASFALLNEYSLLGYLFPIKNWVILLNFFIIGQSVEVSEKTVYTLINKALIVTVLIIATFEVLSSLLDLRFSEIFSLKSRIPFVRYRIGIDEFLILYAYTVISISILRNELTGTRNSVLLLTVFSAFLISQTKQLLVATLLVSIFLVCKNFTTYLSKRRVVYALLVAGGGGAVLTGIMYMVTNSASDTYFSLWRRLLSVAYVRDKLANHLLLGYPIPSWTFGGNIPQDIIRNFCGFDFNTTIFPSDIPLLFILSEEGVTGILFVVALLYLCYRRAPEKALYLVVILLALAGTFRMYYLIPVGSSFTYFMLGLATRSKSGG